MGIAYNPKVITDGLVLALDAGNTKSYPGSGTAWINMFSSKVPNSVGIITCVSILNNTNKFFGAYYNSCAGYTSGTIFDNRPPSISDLNTILQENINCKSYNIGTWNSSYRGIIGGYGGSGDLCTLRFTGWGQNATIYAGVYLNASSRQLRLSGDVSGSPVTFTSPTGGYISFTLTSDPADVTFTNPGGGGDPMYVYWMGAESNTIVLNQPSYSNSDGGVLYFDGTDDHVIVPSNNEFAFGTGDFTIDLWIKTTTTADDGILQISTTSGGFATSYTNGLMLSIYQGSLYYALNGSSVNTSSTINDGSWHHLVMTRSGGSLKLFLDGNSIVSTTNTGNVTATNLVIGGYYSTSYTLDGYISNLRIYKGKGLTAEEVQQNYNALKGRFGL